MKDLSSPTRYMVVGMPRSGTTAVHHTLRGHPSVSAVYQEVAVEPFLTKGMGVFTFEHPETSASVPNLFDAMATAQSDVEYDALGMKLTTASRKLARLFVEGVRTHLPDLRIIILNRHDVVSQFGSLVKSQKTGVWRQRAGHEKKEQSRTLKLDRHDFAQYAIEAYQIAQRLCSLQETHETLEISYEEVLLEGELRSYDPLFEFVDVEPKRADWLADRKLSPPPESYIENYGDLTKLHSQIERQLDSESDAESLYKSYSRPTHEKVWRKASFWGRRPGYAMYRAEQSVRELLGLRNTEDIR